MDLAGLCQNCGKRISQTTCSLCGKNLCTSCMSPQGVCNVCFQGKKQ